MCVFYIYVFFFLNFGVCKYFKYRKYIFEILFGIIKKIFFFGKELKIKILYIFLKCLFLLG